VPRASASASVSVTSCCWATMRISPPVTGKIWLLIRTLASLPSSTRSPRVAMKLSHSGLRFRRRRYDNVQLELVRLRRHADENHLHAAQQVGFHTDAPGVAADVIGGADGECGPGVVLAPRAVGNRLTGGGAVQGNPVAGEVAQVVVVV